MLHLSFLKNAEVLFFKYIANFLKPGVKKYQSEKKSFLKC